MDKGTGAGAPPRPRRRFGGLAVVAGISIAAGLVAVPQAQASLDYFRAAGCQAADIRYRAEKPKEINGKNIVEVRRSISSSQFRFGRRSIKVTPNRDFRRGNPALRRQLNSLEFLALLGAAADGRTSRPDIDGYNDQVRRDALRKLVAIAVGWARSSNAGRIPNQEALKHRITALRMPILAYAGRAGACRGVVNNAQARELRAAIRKDMRVVSRPIPSSEPANHRVTIAVGRVLVGEYLPNDALARRVAASGRQIFRRQLLRGYQRQEGTWLEHSPEYHRLAYVTIDNFRRTIDSNDSLLNEASRNLRRTLGWFVQPDDSLVSWGATGGRPYSSQDVIGSPGRYAGWQPAPLSGFVTYSDRENNWYGLTSQYHFRQHKHHDEGSFDLIHRGQRLVQDTGRWGPGKHRRYERSAVGHSVMLVNGRPFNTELHKQPYGSSVMAVGSGKGWHGSQSRNPLLIAPKGLTKEQRRERAGASKERLRQQLRRARRFDTDHQRIALYKPDQALVILDRVRARRGNNYQRLVQTAPGVRYSNGWLSTGQSAFPITSRLGNCEVQEPSRVDRSLQFPDKRKSTRRTRLNFTSQGRAVDHVMVIGLDQGRTRSASIVGGQIAGTTTIVLEDERGNAIDRLTVSRSNRSLSIE